METLEHIITERVKQLPQAIQNYLKSDDYPKVMRSVIQAQKLHIDKAYDVEVQTTLLLLGLIKPEEYVQALVKEARVSEEVAHTITKEMNEKVFRPIMESYTKPQPKNASTQPEKHKEDQKETVEMQEEIREMAQPKEKHIEKQYAVDPYREPIE